MEINLWVGVLQRKQGAGEGNDALRCMQQSLSMIEPYGNPSW